MLKLAHYNDEFFSICSYLSFNIHLLLRTISKQLRTSTNQYFQIVVNIDLDKDCLNSAFLPKLLSYWPNADRISCGFLPHDYKLISRFICQSNRIRYLINANCYKFRTFRKTQQDKLNALNIVHDIPTKLIYNPGFSPAIRHLDVSLSELVSLSQYSDIPASILTISAFDKFESHVATLRQLLLAFNALPYVHTIRLCRKSNGTDVANFSLNSLEQRPLLIELVHALLYSVDCPKLIARVLPHLDGVALHILVSKLFASFSPNEIYCPHLTNIAITTSSPQNIQWLSHFIPYQPNLSFISVSAPPQFSSSKHYPALIIDQLLLSLPSSLKYLKVLGVFNEPHIKVLATQCPHLVELDIEGSIESFTLLLTALPRLRRLGLSSGSLCFDQFSLGDYSNHPLTLVEFNKNVRASAEDLMDIARYFANLWGFMIQGNSFRRSELLRKE
ncbi:hypothetical protein P9112_007699 [Eukaryota sp. TZLM1-RC]